MTEATLYTTQPSSRCLRCLLCPHHCQIRLGQTGLCHTRLNKNGILYALNYGKLVAARPDPVEKKPLYHFYPGHASYSISSVGCNLTCAHCQNHTISQRDVRTLKIAVTKPEDVVSACIASQCQSISYTYTEPTTMLEFVLDSAKLACAKQIKTIMVSNGYMSNQCIDLLLPHIQAINIDLKAFTNLFYQQQCNATLEPVVNSIRRFAGAGTHIEITTLLISGLNDVPQQLHDMASFIAELNPEIPWHLSRCHPAFKFDHHPPTPLHTLQKAVDIGRQHGLKHIYIGNAPETTTHTRCSHCQTILFSRSGFSATAQSFKDGHCLNCKAKLFGTFY